MKTSMLSRFLLLTVSLAIIGCGEEAPAPTPDSVAPTASSIVIDYGNPLTTTVDVTVALSATDNVGVVAYYLSGTNTTPAASDGNWIQIGSTTYLQQTVAFSLTPETALGSFDKTIYVWFKDAAGNVSGSVSDTITYMAQDTLPPPTPTISINAGAVSTTTTAVTLDLSASDNYNVVAYYVSETSTAPDVSNPYWIPTTAGPIYTSTVPFTLSGATAPGTYTRNVYVWVKDDSGNVSSVQSDSIELVITDTTAPENPALSINAGAISTINTVVNLTISAVDDFAVSAYFVTESYTAPLATDSGWIAVSPSTPNYSATVTYTLSSAISSLPGTYPKIVSVWFKDASGNMSDPAITPIDLVVLDTTAPVMPSVSIDAGSASTTTTSVTLDVSASDDAGISAYYISESAITPNATDSNWVPVVTNMNYTATIPFSLSGASSPGTYLKRVYVWYKDEAGNVSSEASDTINFEIIDITAPVNPAIAINGGDLFTTTTIASLDLSASDDAGITAYFVSENASTPLATDAGWTAVSSTFNYNKTIAFTLTGAGVVPGIYTRTVYVWYKDAAGLVSSPVSDSIDLEVIDVTTPSTPAISIDADAISTTVTAVTLGISATDDAGITAYFASESTTTPSATNAGWISVPSNKNLNVTVPFSLTGTAESGTHIKTVYIWFKDAAGNVSSRANDTIDFIVVDIIPPTSTAVSISSNSVSTTSATVSVKLWGADDLDLAEYYISESPVTPLATDAGWVPITATTSFYGSTIFTLSSTTIPGVYPKTIYVWYKDAAGNISVSPGSDAIDLVVLDVTLPTAGSIVINGGAGSTTGASATVDLSASDNVGVTGYYLSESAVTPYASSVGWVDVTPELNYMGTALPFTFSNPTESGTTTRTVYAWFKDAAGRVSNPPVSAVIDVTMTDTTPPVVTMVINDGAATTDTRNIILTFNASDDYGLAAYHVSESPITPEPVTSFWTKAGIASTYVNYTQVVLLSSPSTLGSFAKSVNIWVKDSSGNISAVSSDDITLNIDQVSVPDTGQINCYDGAGVMITCPAPGSPLAQDGSYNTTNQKSYTDNGDGTTTDNITGLIWQRGMGPAGGYSELYCTNNTANLPGGGWRLPSRKELLWLSPLDDPAFTPAPYQSLWSSSSYYSSTSMTVDIRNGLMASVQKSSGYAYKRCVKGYEAKTSAYVDNGDQTITDIQTGLMWDQRESATMTWEAALGSCEGLSHAGYTDWRLPNRYEFESSISYGSGNVNHIDRTFFPGTSTSWMNRYWTSTTKESSPTQAWYIPLSAQAEHWYTTKSTAYNVRCVR